MYEIAVHEQFEATHYLRFADGTSETPHAHNWQVRVTYTGPALDEAGLLVDFVDVRERLRAVLTELAATTLNDVEPFLGGSASAERVARYIADRLPHNLRPAAHLARVEVEEEPGCFASFCL